MRRILNNPGVRISLAIVVIVGLLLWYFYHATGQFIRAYETYATLSLIEENAAYAPGQPDNPVRREMNQTLAEVLGVKMLPVERLRKAERGLQLVHESEHLLNPIQDRGGDVDQAIGSMRARANSLTELSSWGRERKLIEIAMRRADIVSDVRALTVRANFETGKIFQHIIDAKGALSDAFVIQLNSEIPDVESQFNKRSALYTELGEVSDSIVREYLRLSVFGLPIGGK